MIIIKNTPYTQDEVVKIKEEFEFYIKTVIDIEKKVCSAGCKMHADSEKELLARGSLQSNIWGGGIDVETNIIDFNSLINIRPNQKNPSNEIQDPALRLEYERLTKYFFPSIFI